MSAQDMDDETRPHREDISRHACFASSRTIHPPKSGPSQALGQSQHLAHRTAPDERSGMSWALALSRIESYLQRLEHTMSALLLAIESLEASYRASRISHVGSAQVVSEHAAAAQAVCATLTPREREVLTLMCGGWGTVEIATRLCVKGESVKSHQIHIYRKLGASTHTHAVIIAQQAGFICQQLRPFEHSAACPAKRSTKR